MAPCAPGVMSRQMLWTYLCSVPGLFTVVIVYTVVGAAIFSQVEDEEDFMTFWNGLELSLTTITTIGKRDRELTSALPFLQSPMSA